MSWDLIRFNRLNTARYLRYDSAAKILQTHFHEPSFILADEQNTKSAPPIFENYPAILGVRTQVFGLHCLYWDGSKLWEPGKGRFVKPEKSLEVVYVINKKPIFYNCGRTVTGLIAWEEFIQKNKKDMAERERSNKKIDVLCWNFRAKNPLTR